MSQYKRLSSNSGSVDEDPGRCPGSINAIYTRPTSRVVYKRRWYLLFVFSFMAALQAAIWNTWSPISKSAELVFGWNDGNVALLANWGPITAIVVLTGFSWLLDNYGLRVTALICAFLMAGGAGMRCITAETPASTWLINVGHVMNGIAGVLGGIGCSMFSVVWFPPYQRATATAIALNSLSLGVSLSFVLGPLLVREARNTTELNITHHLPENGEEFHDANTDVIRGEIMRLMYYECGVAVLVLLLVLIYFPAKPPTPPSVSANAGRTDFKQGLLSLIRKKNVWIVAISYSVSMGVGGAFSGVIDVNLKSFNIHQKEAGWIGFFAVLAGTLSAIITARISDRYGGHMKTIIVTCLFFSGLSATWSVLLLSGYIPFSIYELYPSCIMVSLFENAAAPLFFELACETSYPVAEGVTVGLMAFCGNLVGIFFLLMLMIPGIGTIWMNWCLVGTCFFCCGLMLFFKGSYRRLQLDSQVVVNANQISNDDDDDR